MEGGGTAYPVFVVSDSKGAAGPTSGAYAGELLGIPAAGPGSLAPLGRRFGGVIIDWLVAQGVVFLFARNAFGASGAQSFVPLGVFALLTVLSLVFVAATFGHYVFGLQLRQVRPGNYPVQVLVRTALLCLFLPAILTAKDGRGYHDVIAGTVLVRR